MKNEKSENPSLFERSDPIDFFEHESHEKGKIASLFH